MSSPAATFHTHQQARLGTPEEEVALTQPQQALQSQLPLFGGEKRDFNFHDVEKGGFREFEGDENEDLGEHLAVNYAALALLPLPPMGFVASIPRHGELWSSDRILDLLTVSLFVQSICLMVRAHRSGGYAMSAQRLHDSWVAIKGRNWKGLREAAEDLSIYIVFLLLSVYMAFMAVDLRNGGVAARAILGFVSFGITSGR